jgi:hypothetical protein
MSYSFAIEPLSFVPFGDEAEQLDKCKAWGLLSDKAAKVKTFYYKGNGLNEACEIVGFVDDLTAVIRLAGERLHCIHPSYLKEMQASSFGQKFAARTEPDAQAPSEAEEAEEVEEAEAAVEAEAAAEAEKTVTPANAEAEAEVVTERENRSASAAAANQPSSPPASREPEPPSAAATAEKPKAKGGKGKAAKPQLPEEKVRVTAIVKEFATVPNHFSDTDDEVIVYEAVAVLEPELELGEAWSSHSATLKKMELAVGDKLAFEAKIIAKKLTKHPVSYKINNPSKIQKQEA